jgi:coiled-coil domain-containing protein 130
LAPTCWFMLLFLLFLLDQGGLNKFHGQHALRERARKLDQGILIIRFVSCETLLCFLVCTYTRIWS